MTQPLMKFLIVPKKDDKCFLINLVYPYNPFNLVQNFLIGEGIVIRIYDYEF